MEPLEQSLVDARSSEWSTRVEALHRLADFDDPRARQALIDALYDVDLAVTAAAVDAMVASRHDGFVEPLVEAMTGERPQLSDDAASELAE